jgi:hypothetical protein
MTQSVSISSAIGQPKIILRVPGIAGPPGPAPTKEAGVIYLKNNTIPTQISSINGRAVVEGAAETGTLLSFAKDINTNSLRYLGQGGVFHVIATFSFTGGSQNICGFYIGKNQDVSSALDPNADRISESEIYCNSNLISSRPRAAAIQTVCQLNTDDRLFFIVQNQTSTAAITVNFLKLVAIG